MTDHPRLVLLAVRWARRQTRGHGVVLAEPRAWWTGRGQCPDVLAWPSPAGIQGGEGSILVEVKASRADFRADRAKPIHARAEDFPGVRRYYLAPAGLIRADELPPGWGLLEPHGSGAVLLRGPVPFALSAAGHAVETRILTSVVVRWQLGAQWMGAEARFAPLGRRPADHAADLAARRGPVQMALL